MRSCILIHQVKNLLLDEPRTDVVEGSRVGEFDQLRQPPSDEFRRLGIPLPQLTIEVFE